MCGGVVISKPQTKRVIHHDKMWPIFLNVEQFHGIHLGDQRKIVIILVLFWIEKQLANKGVDNNGLSNDKLEAVLGVVYKLLNPKDFLFIKMFCLWLGIEELVVGPIDSVLGGVSPKIMLIC